MKLAKFRGLHKCSARRLFCSALLEPRSGVATSQMWHATSMCLNPKSSHDVSCGFPCSVSHTLYFVGIKPWFSVIVPSCDYQMSPSGSWKILAAMKPSACKGLIHHPCDYRHDTHTYIYTCLYIIHVHAYVCVFLIYTYPYSHISQQACRVPCRKCIQATGFRKLRTPQRSAQLRLGQSQESLQHMLAGPATGDHWRPNIFSAPFQGQRFTAKLPGLVNIQKTMENHHFQWVNPL